MMYSSKIPHIWLNMHLAGFQRKQILIVGFTRLAGWSVRFIITSKCNPVVPANRTGTAGYLHTKERNSLIGSLENIGDRESVLKIFHKPKCKA